MDERFREVLQDKKYVNVPGGVDKYGRKRKSKSAKEELKEFYTIEEDEEVEKVEKEKKPGVSMENRLDYLTKLSRGDISGDSSGDDSGDDASSSDDDDESDDERSDSNAKSALAIDDDEIVEEEGGEATKRLAIQNCDWENLRAVDILTVLKSFCPAGRAIRRLTIYASDFGIKRMEEESKYGPQGIWDGSSMGANRDDDDDDEGVYTGIDKINDDDDDDEDDDDEVTNKHGKNDKSGDFRRKSGSIGIVLQDDLVIRGKAKPDSDHDGAKRDQGSKKSSTAGKSSDYDIVALRKYELSKLRYYFAVAECDTAETANILYEQLDGVELEHSSMVFDLRFVPDDIQFAGRPIKDSCQVVPDNYKAPDFIVNALQHTSVECSWDEGEKEREKKLTNISSWRMLNESDFQQYIASSASESDDDDEHTARVRKALLGHVDGEDGEDGLDHDDFFSKEMDDGDEISNNDDETGDMTFSYVPNVGKELLQRMKDREKQETPWEAKLRKMKEKKQARKMKKTDNKIDGDDDSDNLVGGEDDQVALDDVNNLEFSDDEVDAKHKKKSSKMTKSKPKNVRNRVVDEERVDGKKVVSTDELENLLGSDHHDTKEYDMRAIIKQEKLSKKKKKHRGDNPSSPDNFQLDLQDDRFKALLDGDSRFGIDTTSAEYKETKAMKELLKEQSKRRQNNRETSASAPTQTQDNPDPNTNKLIDQNLIVQLKRKFGSAKNSHQKKKRE